MDESSINPFFEDAFVDCPDNLPGVTGVHAEAFRRIQALAERYYGRAEDANLKQGRLIRLMAPEAGYGKSHLLARLRDSLTGRISTFQLPFDRLRPVSWSMALSALIRQFCDSSPASEFSLFEQVSRAFLAQLIFDAADSQPHLLAGCPVDPHHLRMEYASLLSRNADPKLLQWLDKRADEMGKDASASFHRHWGLKSAEVVFWTRLFLDFNRGLAGELQRLGDGYDGDVKDRLLQLLRIITTNQPALLTVDGLDSLFESDSAGIALAEIIDSIRESVPRSTTVLSVNEDLWRSTFSAHLPSALKDRLESETICLHSLDAETAKELLLFRLRSTTIQDETALRFIQQVASKHRWKEGDYPLSPRRALREARVLWVKQIDSNPERRKPAGGTVRERPAGPPPLPRTQTTDSHRMGETAAPHESQTVGHEVERVEEGDFTGIDSIINDIRGSGKAVISERNERPFPSDDPSAATPFPEAPADYVSGFTAPSSSSVETASETMGFKAPLPSADWPGQSPRSSGNETKDKVSVRNFPGVTPLVEAVSPPPRPPLSRAEFTEIIQRRESELLTSSALTMDTTRIGNFIRRVGSQHTALAQTEERYAGSLSPCLHWKVRELSVIIGFESPRNIYFWNNLLQRSLASNRIEKLTAFSHPSDPFDPTLFDRFGFSPAVVRARVDIIEMNNRELAMIYATEETLNSFVNTPDAERAMQLATLHLDPLWRRMIQSL